MPRYNSDDVHRSVRRWVSDVLGSPPWRVYTERREVPDGARPAAVLEPAAPPRLTRARRTIPQGNIEWAQTVAVTCYPAFTDGGGELLLPWDSRLLAQEVADLLAAGLARGIVDDDGDSLAPPLFVPLYDYEGVEVTGADRRPPAPAYDYLRVDDAQTSWPRALQDPVDHVRFTVPMALAVTWEAPGREAPPAPTAPEGLHGEYDPP